MKFFFFLVILLFIFQNNQDLEHFQANVKILVPTKHTNRYKTKTVSTKIIGTQKINGQNHQLLQQVVQADGLGEDRTVDCKPIKIFNKYLCIYLQLTISRSCFKRRTKYSNYSATAIVTRHRSNENSLMWFNVTSQLSQDNVKLFYS